ncbi:phosphatase PAP2 family protein [Thermogemmatispora sp.]|uniref:phosphatase PAP2 family protein n=1 Tax=Thermogemmatispora sp. TaxID=1968838 RepID=UPI001D98F76F|nr:phosphatase PAP2 family protein [Thermogemmatispora sp.]MBX5449128.1 phosphatase PAP2 family protein [Thermogemmatispora sp.]
MKLQQQQDEAQPLLSESLTTISLKQAAGRLAEMQADPQTRSLAGGQWLFLLSPAQAQRLARGISIVLSPAAISVPFVLLVALYHSPSLWHALGFALLTLSFVSAGPLLYVVLSLRLGLVSDLDLSHRHERWHPFLFSLLSYALGLLLLLLLHAPRNLELILGLTLLLGALLLVITLRWKISIHAATLGGAATVLTAFYGLIFLPSFLLLVLVCWSRVALGRHTLAQVVSGALLSIGLALGVLLLVGF